MVPVGAVGAVAHGATVQLRADKIFHELAEPEQALVEALTAPFICRKSGGAAR